MQKSSLEISKTPFNNLPPLTKEEALKILSKPIDQLELSSDYYKAVFHLFDFPGPDTEQVLLELVKSESEEHCILIARRKAIEVLARHGCINAIPEIGKCLESSDPYLVENAAWALQELSCKDQILIKRISNLIDDPKQNRRLLIQVLGTLGGVSEVSRIKAFLKEESLHPGVRGACIAAIMRLSGESIQTNQLIKYLALPNQNDRQCAVNDVINSRNINLLPWVLKTPVAPSFRLRALNLLWPFDIESVNQLDLLMTIDSVIIDDPHDLDLLGEDHLIKEDSSLVRELMSTDFKKCYMALKILAKKNPTEIWPILSMHLEDMKKDYGALYFLMILFRSIPDWDPICLNAIKSIAFSCLGKDWPDFMKFRPAAILTLFKLYPSLSINYASNWLNESSTPFWACRYATLLAIEPLLGKGVDPILTEQILKSKSDTHRFVSAKAKRIELELLT